VIHLSPVVLLSVLLSAQQSDFVIFLIPACEITLGPLKQTSFDSLPYVGIYSGSPRSSSAPGGKKFFSDRPLISKGDRIQFLALNRKSSLSVVERLGPGQKGLTSSALVQTGRYEDQIPVEARFSAPVQTGPGAHPASYTMDTGSFPGIKSDRSVTLTPHPHLVPLVMIEQSYTTTPPMGHTACTEPQCLYKGDLYLYLTVELYLYSPYGPYGLYRASVPVQG
jgi:hypothetical protein